ncbi:MAG TPA: efflux transporter outer membrane subunit [Spongiibacteraceae bacterium]|jgi:NodT family efflux transporter outer membrane factor (OMF) lipoprotein
MTFFPFRRSRRAVIFIATGLATVAAIGTLSGCAANDKDRAAAKAISAEQLGLTADTEQQWPAQDWWRAFNDEQLNQLIELARADNPSIKIAQARIQLARQYAVATRAINQPDIALNAEVTRQRYSENDIYPPPLGGSISNSARGTLDFSYEFDFWGRQRATLDAALRQIDVERADSAEAQLVLSIAVAQNYFSLQRNFADLTLTEQLQNQRATIVHLLQLRVERGLASKAELDSPTAALANATQQVAAAQQRIDLDRHQLAALCARGADTLQPIAPVQSDEISLPPPIALPADLLARRPDIAAQRLRVEVASKDIVAAKADFYPNIDLSAFFGVQSIGTSDLFASGSRIWGVGPALHLPVFNRASLRAQLGSRYADYDLAVEQYNQSVLDAVRETADAGAITQSLNAQRNAADAALAALQRARSAAETRYRQGLSNRLDLLNADIALLDQQRALLALRDNQLQARLALIKALGGGYNTTSQARY